MFYSLRSSILRHRLQPTIGSEAFPVWFGARFGHTSTPSSRSKCAGVMDGTDAPVDKNTDVIRTSFGEAYATRCDEEGYGGIYGPNQSLLVKQEVVVLQKQNASEMGTKTRGEEDEAEQKIKQPNT